MRPTVIAPGRRGHRPTGFVQARRGAALLTALLIVTLVTTLAAAMLWRQARSIQIESAERGRAQSDWVLQGALDWARVILREDSRANKTAGEDKAVDYNGEVWAVPLAEAKLSSFLSTDDNHSADSGPDVFLSGRIEDAQGKFNLYNLIPKDSQDPNAITQLSIAQRLFQSAGLSASLANDVQKRLRQAYPQSDPQGAGDGNSGGNSGGSSGGSSSTSGSDGTAPVLPTRIDQLSWLNLTADQVDRLRPYVALLPPIDSAPVTVTKVNINTAPREVIAALNPRIGLGDADRIVRAREAKGIQKGQIASYLNGLDLLEVAKATSDYFIVTGQLRLDDRLVTMRSLVWRNDDLRTVVLDRQYIQQSTALIAGQGR